MNLTFWILLLLLLLLPMYSLFYKSKALVEGFMKWKMNGWKVKLRERMEWRLFDLI